MTASTRTQRRVLLVEDDPDTATFFSHVLGEGGGYEVSHTADPAVALGLAQRESWDLLVSDFQLPGMTGLDLLAAVRQARPALPVVIVTAHDPALIKLPGGPPDALLYKPIGPAKLIDTAARLISGRSR